MDLLARISDRVHVVCCMQGHRLLIYLTFVDDGERPCTLTLSQLPFEEWVVLSRHEVQFAESVAAAECNACFL